jgi:hypothetical protein
MASELKGGETVLTGVVEDRSALFGVVAQIEAFDLELLELRQITAGPTAQAPGDRASLPMVVGAQRLAARPTNRRRPP